MWRWNNSNRMDSHSDSDSQSITVHNGPTRFHCATVKLRVLLLCLWCDAVCLSSAFNFNEQSRYSSQEKWNERFRERVSSVELYGSALEKRWWRRFDELVRYKAEVGNCLVPRRYSPNQSLSNWVSSQRRLYKNKKLQVNVKSSLDDERIEWLNDLGFVFDVHEYSWNCGYEELAKYHEQYGHCLVPERCNENQRLGDWVRNQRKAFHEYKLEGNRANKTRRNICTAKMTPERIEKLESLGFIWDVKEALWFSKLEKLKEFKKVYGHCSVPYTYEADQQLAFWVCNQRALYKNFLLGTSSTMNVDHVKILNSLDFVWDAQEDRWLERFEQLREYKEKFGHTVVPQRYKENPQLGRWVTDQRVMYRAFMEESMETRSVVVQRRIDMLNWMGFCWNAMSQRSRRNRN